MKVSDLLESRRTNWRELDQLCSDGRTWRKVGAPAAARFASLYRAACADLALADAYQLPPGTIRFLHRLVGHAHNRLYRTRGFRVGTWGHQLLVEVPQRLFADNYLRLSFCIFWGVFLLSAFMAFTQPGHAERLAGKEFISMVEEMHSQPPQGKPGMPGRRGDASQAMVGFYIFNNTTIGLRCFAFGLLLGVGGLYETLFNAALLGAVFGHMANVPDRQYFFQFVTAHSVFELTAIVLSAAAGMRLGFSLILTRGATRLASLRRAGREAMPIMGATMVMFTLAALIEGFLSPSPAPYWIKAMVAVVSAGLLMFYFVILGRPRQI
jgi:uncharacterized membrane protein SpoIIM required for sporulation